MKRLLLLAVAVLPATGLFAQVRFHNTFGDNMVLQQGSRTIVKGKAAPGEKLTFTCSWEKGKKTLSAASDSTWNTEIIVPEASFEPHWMQVSAKSGKARVENILFGEVWLCLGQSNMEMPVRGFPSQPVKGSLGEILGCGRYPALRLYDVKHKWSEKPLEECDSEWKLPTPENVSLFSAVAYVFGSRLTAALNVPVGIVLSSYGGSRIESWMNEDALSTFVPDKDYIVAADKPYRDPYKLYNAMIVPVNDVQVKGVVWLQGESNRRNAGVYCDMLKRMISLWRNDRNNEELPFLIIQIAPCPYNGVGELGAVRIMEAQFKAASETAESYIVGTSDIGAEHFIHFPEKVVLGERVCVSALANVYGVKGLPKGNPYVREVRYEGGKAYVSFANADRGLTPMDGEVLCFELAGEDGVYYPASGKLDRNNRSCIVVTSAQVANPVNVRFAFSNWHQVNLFSNEGLPAYPFRSDNVIYE